MIARDAMIAAAVVVSADMLGDWLAQTIAATQAPTLPVLGKPALVPIELVPLWLLWGSRVVVGAATYMILESVL